MSLLEDSATLLTEKKGCNLTKTSNNYQARAAMETSASLIEMFRGTRINTVMLARVGNSKRSVATADAASCYS